MSVDATLCNKKSRIKSYFNNTFYLRNKQNFELELFNGETEEVLVKIWINEQSIHPNSIGFLLKPGQRVWLERFGDSNNKFEFSTYNVENSPEAKSAISNNGKVRIEYYKRTGAFSFVSLTAGTPPTYNSLTILNGNPTCTVSSSRGYSTLTSSVSSGISNIISSNNTKEDLETGRVEKGANSNQKLDNTNDNSIWNSWYFKQFIFQLLPDSQKPETFTQVANYCSGCGTRIKTEHRFCPTCGKKH